jgi:hypothetical protein
MTFRVHRRELLRRELGSQLVQHPEHVRFEARIARLDVDQPHPGILARTPPPAVSSVPRNWSIHWTTRSVVAQSLGARRRGGEAEMTNSMQAVAPTAAVSRPRNPLAIGSFVCGIVWLGGLASFVALVLGVIALVQISNSGGLQRGKGFAIAGIVLAILGFAVPILLVFATSDSSSGPVGLAL